VVPLMPLQAAALWVPQQKVELLPQAAEEQQQADQRQVRVRAQAAVLQAAEEQQPVNRSMT
jgi:hypothetical protein